MKKRQRIYIDQWLALKPYKKHSPTDRYYLELCNKVQEILSNEGAELVDMYFDKEDIAVLSCFLVSYFEDIISGTNIWNSFVRKHEEMYGKKLPFYPTDEYDEGEINEQDVRFLIWYFINSWNNGFLNAKAGLLDPAAEGVMELFEEAYEYAPENEVLQAVYQLKPESDYYKTRGFIDTVLFKTYLFYPDMHQKMKEAEEEIAEEYGRDLNIINLLNENRDELLHASYTKLLGLKGKEWAAEILGKEHPLYPHLTEMSDRVSGLFLYKGQDANHISLEHIASGKTFQLIKESYENAGSLRQVGTIVFLSMVKWKEEWWFSGITFQQEYNGATVAEEKQSIRSRQSVAFLDHANGKAVELVREHRDKFLSFNNGAPIHFLPASQVNQFVNKFMEYHKQSLELSEKELEEAQQRAQEQGLPASEEVEVEDFSDFADDALVFFNPKSGIEMAFGICSAFPTSENPFYEGDDFESEEAFADLLMTEEISPELVHYCIDQYKDKLPFLEEMPYDTYLANLDFMLRFWKGKNYHTKPAISMI